MLLTKRNAIEQKCTAKCKLLAGASLSDQQLQFMICLLAFSIDDDDDDDCGGDHNDINNDSDDVE